MKSTNCIRAIKTFFFFPWLFECSRRMKTDLTNRRLKTSGRIKLLLNLFSPSHFESAQFESEARPLKLSMPRCERSQSGVDTLRDHSHVFWGKGKTPTCVSACKITTIFFFFPTSFQTTGASRTSGTSGLPRTKGSSSKCLIHLLSTFYFCCPQGRPEGGGGTSHHFIYLNHSLHLNASRKPPKSGRSLFLPSLQTG